MIAICRGKGRVSRSSGILLIYSIMMKDCCEFLLCGMLQNTDKSKPGAIAKAAVGVIMLLGHLAVGVYFYHAFNSGMSYFV